VLPSCYWEIMKNNEYKENLDRLNKLVGTTFEIENRKVKILLLLSGAIEAFYLCAWEDTNEVFCEDSSFITSVINQ
jgi:hypothetical protein